jgi:superfamily II DNA helicase RecQ
MDTIVARLLFIEQNLMMLNLSNFNVKDFTVIGDTATKQRIFQEWRDNQFTIVSTNAFSAGIGIPNIGLDINVREPKSLSYFAQQSGRAGQQMLLVLEFISQTLDLLSMSKHPNH